MYLVLRPRDGDKNGIIVHKNVQKPTWRLGEGSVNTELGIPTRPGFKAPEHM